MKPHDLPPVTGWTLARRAERMNPSVIREILKVTEQPGIISFAGGLPSPRTFRWTRSPRRASARRRSRRPAVRGQRRLRSAARAVAAMLPWAVDPRRC